MQKDQVEFNKEPYSESDKFNIYIPKARDPVLDLIKRENDAMSVKSKIPVPPSNEEYYKVETAQDQLREEEPKVTQSCQKVEVTPSKGLIGGKQLVPGKSKTYQLKPYFRTQQGSPRERQTKLPKLQLSGSQPLKKTLRCDSRQMAKSKVRNQVVDDILTHSNVFTQRKELMESLEYLSRLDLLRPHNMNVHKFPGVGKVSFVFNDYHTKSTNNGYSRNFGGVFFTR